MRVDTKYCVYYVENGEGDVPVIMAWGFIMTLYVIALLILGVI